ncbi:methyl-accepting chemotaxis protein [Cupriavidus sp. CV2]|uniref:methyl-accepting chemotaxis protein n=1 Tax=Cupriavidus ulmosensis TaxID=3065913 RepID=UPI00296AADE0|nr:methyl-accepting chemotaxis protein [Cupriavidus sp. CV2]MDW3683785.1 methyl-accepting chemotaxis protein [Cupriavidus sp. CV2]
MTASSLRTRIVLITSATVVGALALSGAATYGIVRANMTATMESDLSAVASGNTLAIEQWVTAKALAVKTAAEVVEKGDPTGLVKFMGTASGFPVTTIGWTDKSYYSSSTTTPKDYDPTTRPWYKGALAAGKLTVTKPYGDVSTRVPYVSFAAPLIRDGATIGAVSGAVPLEGVREVVKAIHPTASSLAFVVASDGQVIAHPDANQMLKPVSEVTAALTPAMLEKLVRASAPLEVEIQGLPKLLKAQAVAGTDWYLVIALDKAEATVGLRGVVSAMGIALVLLTLAALGIATFFTAKAFRRLSRVRDAMDTIGTGGGDLTRRLDVVGNDEVAQISASFNAFVEKIGAVLIDVRASVQGMTSATGEIEAGNRDLSHRTEASASNLQETSAALTQLASSVKQTAEAAEQATQLATDASATAARGGEVVSGAVRIMDEIARSSGRITEIIGVIDSIAFQTNILALNAAVEAARAGEQGRGFAVVAGEVRTLAQRSATAAQEIKGLIESSVASVSSGTERVQAAGSTMAEIVKDIEHVRRIITEIHGAVSEQNTGIGQLDQSVSEMDQATQQNAALVEESAAASSMLSDQAQELARTVARFQLREA